jgi:hypothetical protein
MTTLYDGNLSISRTSNEDAHGARCIVIDVRVPELGGKVVTVSVSPYQFALALTGLAEVEASVAMRLPHSTRKCTPTPSAKKESPTDE